MTRIRAHLNVVIAVVVTAALTAGGPAIAHGVKHALFAHRAGNAAKVDGLHAVKATAANKNNKLVATDATGKLPATIIPKADADTLDGNDSTAFLGATDKAADSDLLDGQDSSSFLGSSGKAADADMLDGNDSTAFLGANAKAADADLLDGQNSSAFAGASHNHNGVYSPVGHGHSGADITSGTIDVARLPAANALDSELPTAGSGLTNTAGVFSVNTSTIQSRVTGTCTGANFVQSIASGGTVGCGAAWVPTGNAGTNPASNFLGTTDNQPLEFRANNSRALRITPSGSEPIAQFEGPVTVEGPRSGMHFGSVGRQGQALGWTPGAGQNGLWLEYGGSDLGADESGGFFANGNTAAIWSAGDGNLFTVYDEDFVGPTPLEGAAKFWLGPSGQVNSLQGAGPMMADGFTPYSSRRLKTNIRTLQSPLDKVRKLRGVRFDWKSDGRSDIGLIAEEVNKVFPEIVARGGKGRVKGVDYSKLVSVLIEGMKDQQKQIDRLERLLK